jgi:hypothetical protein
MNILKQGLFLSGFLSILTTTATAIELSSNTLSYHEGSLNKEGKDTRLSVALFSSKPEEGDAFLMLNAQVAQIIDKNIEVVIDTNVFTAGGDTGYRLGTGANYYFKEVTEAVLPYAGVQIGFNGNTNANTDTSFDNRIYVGAHKFLNSYTAITPEAGFQFIDFTDYQQAYFNIFLTFFFDTKE